MPSRSASRRKAKKHAHKMTTLTTPNYHSSSTGKSDPKPLKEVNGSPGNNRLRPISQNCQGVMVEEQKGKKNRQFSSAGYDKMEESFKRTSEETQMVESRCEESEDKEVIVEGNEVADDDKSRSAIETHNGDVSIYDNSISDEHSEPNEVMRELVDYGKVKETAEVSEEVVDTEPVTEFNDRIEAKQDLVSPEKEGFRETIQAEESKPASSEHNIGSSLPPTITEATSKVIEKTQESLSVIYESSRESANNESLQVPLPNVVAAAAETTYAGVPENTENPNIVSVSQVQRASWSSCCGLLEILRGGDR